MLLFFFLIKTVNRHKKQKTKWRNGSASLLREKNRKCLAAVDVQYLSEPAAHFTNGVVTYGRISRRTDGWMMEGWMEGSIDRWIDGWMDGTPGQPTGGLLKISYFTDILLKMSVFSSLHWHAAIIFNVYLMASPIYTEVREIRCGSEWWDIWHMTSPAQTRLQSWSVCAWWRHTWLPVGLCPPLAIHPCVRL